MMPFYCPECEAGLAPDATSCRCGWTLPVARVAPKDAADLEAEDLAERTRKAREWMAERGIAERLEGESDADFRRRTLRFLLDNSKKMGGRAA